MELQTLRFPIGIYKKPDVISSEQISDWIVTISKFPQKIESITNNLSAEELNYHYRPEGWTIKQVVHHCADSHCNSFIRFKLALTENNPAIKPYMENLWAELIDGKDNDLTYSIMILKGIHHKWVKLLQSFTEEDWKRTFYHSEADKTFRLDETLGLYAWHSEHHLKHIENALKYKY